MSASNISLCDSCPVQLFMRLSWISGYFVATSRFFCAAGNISICDSCLSCAIFHAPPLELWNDVICVGVVCVCVDVNVEILFF